MELLWNNRTACKDTCIPHKMTGSTYYGLIVHYGASPEQNKGFTTKQRLLETKPSGKSSVPQFKETYASEFKISKELIYFWLSWGSNRNKSQTSVVIYKTKKTRPQIHRLQNNWIDNQWRKFTNEDLSNIPNVENDLKSKINLRNLSIMNEVMKQLSSLKPYEACGPDAIPSWFLKRICNWICAHLSKHFSGFNWHLHCAK